MGDLEQAQAKLDAIKKGSGAAGPGPVLGDQDLESYTEKELAPRLKVTRQTLRNWRKAGCGPPFLRIGRNVRYPHRGFILWLDTQSRTKAD